MKTGKQLDRRHAGIDRQHLGNDGKRNAEKAERQSYLLLA